MTHLNIESKDAGIFLLMLQHGTSSHHVFPNDWTNAHPGISCERKIDEIEYFCNDRFHSRDLAGLQELKQGLQASKS